MNFTDQIRQFAVSSQSKAAKAVEGVRVAVSESVINKTPVDTGAWVSGVGGNQSGETDRYGNKVHGIPNIGINQKAGAPISGNRSTGKSRIF